MTKLQPAERFNPHDPSFAYQTAVHHMKRYEFAAAFDASSYLDICCGYGYGLAILGSKHPDAYLCGIDQDLNVIKQAQADYPKYTYWCQDLRCFSSDQKYDVVTFMEAIEHLTFHDGLRVLKNLNNHVLAPHGILILSTPKDTNDKYNIYHKSIWTYAILKNELGSLFPDVKIYGQDWDTGEISDEDVMNNDFYICVCRKD